jgi:hypothetical protein
LPVPPHASVPAKGSSAAGPDCVYGEERLFICLLLKYLLGCSVLRMVRVHDEETRATRVRLDYGVVAFGVRVHDGMDAFATRRG